MATNGKSSGSKAIARPYKTRMLFRLSGTSSLLCNPSTPKLVHNLIAGVNPGKDTRPLKEQAQDKLLTNSDGNYVVPRSWVFACLREAGKRIPYRSSKEKITSGSQGTKLPSLLHIEHTSYVIHDGKGNPLTNWQVDAQKGNNSNAGKGKGVAVGIVRPRFDLPWAIDVEMTIRTDRIDPEKVLSLLEVAGEEFGLGDARPGMGKLESGMFEVTHAEVLGTIKAPAALQIQGLEKMVSEEEAPAAQVA